jgi:hypothetical protein
MWGWLAIYQDFEGRHPIDFHIIRFFGNRFSRHNVCTKNHTSIEWIIEIPSIQPDIKRFIPPKAYAQKIVIAIFRPVSPPINFNLTNLALAGADRSPVWIL